jgi:hypothetical protein
VNPLDAESVNFIVTQQQQAVRAAWLPVTLMIAATMMLVAAIICFVLSAPGAGDAFLAVLGAVGVVALAAGIVSRNRTGSQ